MSSRRAHRHALVLGALLLVGSPGVALGTTRVPYAPEVRAAIEETFLDARGEADPRKLAAVEDTLARKRAWIEAHVYDERRHGRGQKKKRARRKAERTDTVLALDRALERLASLAVETDDARRYRLGAEILTLDYATRSYHYPLASIQMPRFVANVLVDWDAAGSTEAGDGPREASNLVDPGSGEYYTAEELDRMIAAGFDVSKLDPPGDGTLWRRVPDVASASVRDHYLGGGDALHAGTPVAFPGDGARFELHGIRMTQSKPKIDVRWRSAACRARPEAEQEDCEQTFKLKFGGESHSDPVANALMSMLGYNTDVSAHIKRPRVDLGDVELAEFRRDWENYFDRQQVWTRLELDEALLPGGHGHGRDERGEYLIFVAAGIEAKPAALRRIGPWSNGRIQPSALARGMREARGLAIVNVWIGNADLKDAENNKVLLREGEDGELEMYMNLQDAGSSLGRILSEKVDAFPWDVVEQDIASRAYGGLRDRIELNYFSIYDTGLSRMATHADHRWAVRLIASLGREQIADAVALGRFPGGIGALYVEKLINRRNQLVEAFGLTDEFPPLEVDRALTTADGTVVEGRAARSSFPDETPIALSEHWRELARPMGRSMWRTLRASVAGAVGSLDAIGGEVDLEGTDIKLFPDVLVNLSRRVVPNPAPEGALDQYIVEDSMVLGIRFAAGTFARGRVTLRRHYRLAYTVRSEWQGKLHRNQALNWFLPLRARRGDLPERFVLLRDTEIGPGVELGTPDPSDRVTGGASVGLDTLYMDRVAIENRPDGASVWLVKGPQIRGEGAAWLKLFVLRFDLFRSQLHAGRTWGDVYRLDHPPGSDESMDASIAALLRGQEDPIRATEAARHTRTRIRYLSFWRRVDLFFLSWSSRDRRDRIEFADARGVATGRRHQSMRQRSFRWSLLDNGESYTCNVTSYLSPDAARDGEGSGGFASSRPVVVASYLIDDRNAHSDELDDYHGFLSGLGGRREALATPFRAADWEQTGRRDGRWGRLFTQAQLVLRGDALERLTDVEAAVYWEALAANLGLSGEEVRRIGRRFSRFRSKPPRSARRRVPNRVIEAVDAMDRSLALLARARRAGSPERRLDRIARAVEAAGCFGSGRVQIAPLSALLTGIEVDALAKGAHASVRGRIRTPVEQENKLPERRDFVARLGKRPLADEPDVIAEPFDPIDLYHMLDWVRGAPKRGYIELDAL